MKKTSQTINVYDFDHTIYDGDASLDFYLFSVRRKPTLLGYLPFQLWHALLFIFGTEDRTIFKGNFFCFLRGIDSEKYVHDFWDGHFEKIKDWYLHADHQQDVIISASPEFLLKPAFERVKAHTLIATRMNPKTGIITGKNCRGEEKVARLHEAFDKPVVWKAYADSPADKYILGLAKEKYLVHGDKINLLKQ